jgi:hypothetical protein
MQRTSAPGSVSAPGRRNEGGVSLDDDNKGGAGASTTAKPMTNGSADRGYGGSSARGAERDISSNNRTAQDEEVQQSSPAFPVAAAAAPQKKKNTDWPLRGIQEPHDNDVLFGRGGE